MISEPDYELLAQFKRDRTRQVWSFGVALPIALLLWALLTHQLLWHLTAGARQQTPEQMIVMNTSQFQIIQKHPTYSIARQKAAPPPTQPHPRHERQPQPVRQEQPHPQTRPRELARITPHAPSLAEQLAQQQAAFAHEAQQISHSNAISVATADPRAHDAVTTPFRASFAGTQILSGKGDGYLVPLQRWRDHGENCYYGRYDWSYPTGGDEEATIPWAFCYPPREDPIAHGEHEFPFPLPLPGYRLPAGTELQPIEKDVYDDWLAHQ